LLTGTKINISKDSKGFPKVLTQVLTQPEITKTHSYKRTGQDLVSIQELRQSEVCYFHYPVTAEKYYAREVRLAK
jgi:hypothetical protein